MAEKEFYVKVEDYTNLRADILKCSKDIISVLKDYGRINTIRTEKIEKIIELKRVMSDIKKLNDALSQKIPKDKVTVPGEKKRIYARPVKKEKEVVQEIQGPEENPEVNVLEQELREIEERLNKLNA